MKEKCLGLFNKDKSCVIVGEKNGKEIVYKNETPMGILGDLHWDGYLDKSYFDYVSEIAKTHLEHPSVYEKSMWKLARGNKPLTVNEDSIWLFSCWAEDKFKAKQVAFIIRRFVLLDKFYLKFKEDTGTNKIIVEEGKLA